MQQWHSLILPVSCVAASSHRRVRREQNQKTCEKQKQNGGGAPPEDERKAAEMPTAYHAFCSALRQGFLIATGDFFLKKGVKEKKVFLGHTPKVSRGTSEITYLL